MAKTTTEIKKRQHARRRRQRRVRSKVIGTSERPRLAVFRSNTGIYAQVIDDSEGRTLISASTLEISDAKLKKSEAAEKVGELLAGRAKDKKIDKVVLDRRGYMYHGRVKALAESMRKGGIKF